MPHFNEQGHDTYLCQICGNVFDAQTEPAVWRADLTGRASAGNVCRGCVTEHSERTAAAAQDRRPVRQRPFPARFPGTDAVTGKRFAAGAMIQRVPGTSGKYTVAAPAPAVRETAAVA